MILLSAEAGCLEICFPPQRGACSRSLHRKLTKRKFAIHHSGRRVVALIVAVSWHFGSILPRNQHGARCLGKTGAELRTRALAQKPGTDHDFLGKFGADLCGPEHLAKNPSRRARFSRQNKRGPARTLAFRPETYRGPRFCRQNRRGPCSGLLGITKVTTGTYPNWSSNQHSVSLSRTKLSHCMGEGRV